MTTGCTLSLDLRSDLDIEHEAHQTENTKRESQVTSSKICGNVRGQDFQKSWKRVAQEKEESTCDEETANLLSLYALREEVE